jgi:hypothetical protein
MIAAIYARKSTERKRHRGRAEVDRATGDHARQYAAKKGWTFDESVIFVDDGISGAEFSNRPQGRCPLDAALSFCSGILECVVPLRQAQPALVRGFSCQLAVRISGATIQP